MGLSAQLRLGCPLNRACPRAEVVCKLKTAAWLDGATSRIPGRVGGIHFRESR